MKDYKNYLGHYIDTLRELGMDIQNSKEELLDMILGLPGDRQPLVLLQWKALFRSGGSIQRLV